MNISDTFKKLMDTTADIETNLGNPMACFLEKQEREEKAHKKDEKAHHKKIKDKDKSDN
ncbi:hypothetical protein [Clostridium sp.]|uniref:hypothetical protein n=1 Tax=Clostridium sp. TaxID=1506 RepID=UPI002621630C